MKCVVPANVEAQIDALIKRYPQPRSAVVMVLHALQECFGHIPPEAIHWTATKLGLRPIHILELVTFYPMFKQKKIGKFHLRVCRTLSCALAGSHELHSYICKELGLDPEQTGPQTTADGLFTVEFVECLASCNTAPVIMCNHALHEKMSIQDVKRLLDECRKIEPPTATHLMAAEHGFEP
ncbi:MAG: NAD(P)H-dependent oxidoreductase subunit E [Verrucomicrobiae bacterium]|nr:NAD(P)H-dependent oxidoreductase subunit E [Verrucomicrobiae bacterium]